MPKRSIRPGACALVVVMVTSLSVAEEKMSTADKQWLEQVVAALITEDEVDVFKDLETDEERAIFKRIFWARRDPTPATAENEFRDEFEKRRLVADGRYREQGRAGSATDRGRLFLLLGPPREIEGGNASERRGAPVVERDAGGEAPVRGTGLGTQGETGRESILGEMVPREEASIQTWGYAPNEAQGIPKGLNVRFRAQAGFGYRFVGSKELDQALESVKSRNIVSPDIAYEKDERGRLKEPALPTEEGTFRPTNPVLLRLRATRALTSDLPFRVSADFFRSSDDLVFVPMVFDIDKEALGWAKGRANVAIAGLVEGEKGNAITEFNETTVFREDANAAAVFEIPLHLAPGRYTIYLGVLDTDAMTLGTKIQSLEVPALSCEHLETSSVLLFTEGKRVEETLATPGRAFVIGGYHFVPKIDTVYGREDQLSGVFQACGYGLEGGRPRLTARYFLLRDGVKRGQTRDGPFLSANQETAITIFDIPLGAFESGNYALRIEVRDHVKGDMVTKEIPFEIR